MSRDEPEVTKESVGEALALVGAQFHPDCAAVMTELIDRALVDLDEVATGTYLVELACSAAFVAGQLVRALASANECEPAPIFAALNEWLV